MNETDATLFYSSFESKFTNWALDTDDIRAAFIVGSQVRESHKADAWSDMDIVIYAQNPKYYLENDNWIKDLGNVICSFAFITAGNDPERLTLFEGGWQVDFVIHSIENLQSIVLSKSIPNNFFRGVKVIIDKDNVSCNILPKKFHAPVNMPVTQEKFANTIQMFWFAAIYMAKQVLRNELWIVKMRDWDLKILMLQIVEWHEQVLNGNDYDTWHAGRFIHDWVNADIYKELYKVFAHFDRVDSWDGLLASISLFKTLSQEIEEKTGFTYSHEFESYAYSWIRSHSSLIKSSPVV